MSKLLETFQELNLSNYGPDDVDQLNTWAIDAYAELSAIKEQEPVAEIALSDDGYKIGLLGALSNHRLPIGTKLYAAPVSEAKAQGEYGDAYQGAREDLAIWKRRALEAEKALQEERIITERLGNALNEENGPTFMGEPVFPAKAKGVVIDADDLAQFIREIDGDHKMGAGVLAEHIADRLNASTVQQVSVPDEMRSLAQRLREYNQNPHHINPMSEAFHILVADAANALSTACVPKEIAAAITWSEHLLFECGALTSTRAPSVHVYNKTFAAVNEARAMLAAAPAAPAADEQFAQLRAEVDYYRFNLRNVLKDIRDDLARGGMAPSWKGVAETISVVLNHDTAGAAGAAADALYEAVTPDVVEWLRCGLAANNRLVDGTHPALERVRAALAAHRAKGAV